VLVHNAGLSIAPAGAEEVSRAGTIRAGMIVRLVVALIALAPVAAAQAETIAPTADALGLSPAAVRSMKEDGMKTKTPLVIATPMSTCMVLRGEQARAR
jgi:hypothetical protein